MERCDEKWQLQQIWNLRIWKEIKKLRGGKIKRARTYTNTHTHTFCELTPQLHCYIRGKPRQTCDRTENLPSEGKRIKCEEQKHVNLLCPKESELLCCVFCRIVFFNSSLLPTNVIRQRWQMWHDSSAWGAAAATDRKLLAAQCATRRKFVETKPHI